MLKSQFEINPKIREQVVDFIGMIEAHENRDEVLGRIFFEGSDESGTGFVYYKTVSDCLDGASSDAEWAIVSQIQHILNRNRKITATQIYTNPVVVCGYEGGQTLVVFKHDFDVLKAYLSA